MFRAVARGPREAATSHVQGGSQTRRGAIPDLTMVGTLDRDLLVELDAAGVEGLVGQQPRQEVAAERVEVEAVAPATLQVRAAMVSVDGPLVMRRDVTGVPTIVVVVPVALVRSLAVAVPTVAALVVVIARALEASVLAVPAALAAAKQIVQVHRSSRRWRVNA